MNNEQNRIANRNAALRWGGFVVGMLSLQVAGGAYAIYLATGDPSVAVVPDYHERALNWDQQIQLQQQSATLKWTVQLTVAGGPASQSLVVNVKDAAGNFVPIQSGVVQLYHHARAGSVLRVPVQSNPGESIVVQDCFSRSGLWQVEVDLIDPAGHRFIDSQAVNINSVVDGQEGGVMVALGIAVLIASLLGSLHCVGMCGPLALWATGGGQHRGTIVAYHIGRLSTYLIAGLLAGLLGSAVNIGGHVAGYQMLAAKIAGVLLVVVGVHRLLSLHPRFRLAIGGENPSRVAALLQKAKPLLTSRGPRGRAYLGGLLTTWLPCGWLYLFIFVAAGTGGVLAAMTVMSAFWVGTLPALTAVWFGARSIVPRMGGSLPLVAGVLLIVTGIYTATGRAAADLSKMTAPQIAGGQLAIGRTVQPGSTLPATSLTGLAKQPLPCCDPEAKTLLKTESASSEIP